MSPPKVQENPNVHRSRDQRGEKAEKVQFHSKDVLYVCMCVCVQMSILSVIQDRTKSR